MERCLHARKEFDQFPEPRVAARVATSADGDTFNIIVEHVQAGKRIVGDIAETFKAAVILFYTSRAIVTAFFEGQAMPATEGLGVFHPLKIAVFTKTPAVDARPATDVNGQLCHCNSGLLLTV
jgi:hypothetical protein